MQRSNFFQEVSRRLTLFRASSAYNHEQRLLATSSFYERIGDNTIDSILRKLVTIYFEQHELETKYQNAKRNVYTVITKAYGISEKSAKECAAYVFVNRDSSLLQQLEEIIGIVFLDAADIGGSQLYNLSQSINPINNTTTFRDIHNVSRQPQPALVNQTIYTNNSVNLGLPSVPSRNTSVINMSNTTLNTSVAPTIASSTSKNARKRANKKARKAALYDDDDFIDQDIDTFEYDMDDDLGDMDDLSMYELKQELNRLNAFNAQALPAPKKAQMSQNTYLQALGGGVNIDQYLLTVEDYKTELNYFHQLLKTNLPQYTTTDVGKMFQVTVVLDFPVGTANDFRRSSYQAKSDPQKNTDLAKTEAAKRLLEAVYRDNPERWSEFVKIKQKKNLRY